MQLNKLTNKNNEWKKKKSQTKTYKINVKCIFKIV